MRAWPVPVPIELVTWQVTVALFSRRSTARRVTELCLSPASNSPFTNHRYRTCQRQVAGSNLDGGAFSTGEIGSIPIRGHILVGVGLLHREFYTDETVRDCFKYKSRNVS